MPEFYDDAQQARAAYVRMKFQQPLYWGVHYRGQHLVGKIRFYLSPTIPEAMLRRAEIAKSIFRELPPEPDYEEPDYGF